MTQEHPQPLGPSPEERQALMQVALGAQKADLVVVNATLLNVYTAELLDDTAISVKGRFVAQVGSQAADDIGPATKVIDADGKTVIPGLIEGHTHLAALFTVDQFLRYAMAGGTTSIITETMEAYPVAGLSGVKDLLASFQDQPVKIFGTAPAMTSISSSARGIDAEDLRQLLARGDILGMGESYWQSVLQAPQVMLPQFAATLSQNKLVEGHTAGASPRKLAAYIAAGVSSCHEPIKAQEVLDRLRLGLHVMIREGSIRRDLEQISTIKDTGIDLRRLILTTDGISPKDLLEKGYLEYVVQKAIRLGFDPKQAVQMATLNVAEHFGLDGVLGGIAPGKYADMLIIPHIGDISAEVVISNGREIAREGKLTVAPRKHSFAAANLATVKLPHALQAADFKIPLPRHTSDSVRVRVIEMVTDLVSTERQISLPVVEGEVACDPREDLAKVAAIERHHHPGRCFTGLIKGFGLKSGAIACSAAWDVADIVIVGASDSDMALAVNRIHQLQGGVVVCEDGQFRAELALPIFGLLSELPLEELADEVETAKQAMGQLGVPFQDPLLSLLVLTGAAIPFLRICEEGLVTLKDGRTHGVVVRDIADSK